MKICFLTQIMFIMQLPYGKLAFQKIGNDLEVGLWVSLIGMRHRPFMSIEWLKNALGHD